MNVTVNCQLPNDRNVVGFQRWTHEHSDFFVDPSGALFITEEGTQRTTKVYNRHEWLTIEVIYDAKSN